MIKKLAVLVIEKADGTHTLSIGEKGPIAAEARELIHAANDSGSREFERITALGEAGVLKHKRWKGNIPASATAIDPVDPPADDVGDEDAEGPDADKIRADLKAKGVSVPPRITVDNLIKLAEKNGVEV